MVNHSKFLPKFQHFDIVSVPQTRKFRGKERNKKMNILQFQQFFGSRRLVKPRAAVLQFHYYFRFRKPDKSEDKAKIVLLRRYFESRIHEKNKRKKRKFYTSCVIFKPYALGIERRKIPRDPREKKKGDENFTISALFRFLEK